MESYTVRLDFYKEMRLDTEFGKYNSLIYMAREMIYYNYWSDVVMNYFLNSNDDIENIIDNLNIVSCDDFLENGKF